MQESGQPTALQLLYIELRVGLARSAIQAALLLNGGAAVTLLLFLAHVVGSPVDGPFPANVAVFGLGLFVASMTFVNAYVAQGAIASGQSNAQYDAALGPQPHCCLPATFPRRDCPCGCGDLS